MIIYFYNFFNFYIMKYITQLIFFILLIHFFITNLKAQNNAAVKTFNIETVTAIEDLANDTLRYYEIMISELPKIKNKYEQLLNEKTKKLFSEKLKIIEEKILINDWESAIHECQLYHTASRNLLKSFNLVSIGKNLESSVNDCGIIEDKKDFINSYEKFMKIAIEDDGNSTVHENYVIVGDMDIKKISEFNNFIRRQKNYFRSTEGQGNCPKFHNFMLQINEWILINDISYDFNNFEDVLKRYYNITKFFKYYRSNGINKLSYIDKDNKLLPFVNKLFSILKIEDTTEYLSLYIPKDSLILLEYNNYTKDHLNVANDLNLFFKAHDFKKEFLRFKLQDIYVEQSIKQLSKYPISVILDSGTRKDIYAVLKKGNIYKCVLFEDCLRQGDNAFYVYSAPKLFPLN